MLVTDRSLAHRMQVTCRSRTHLQHPSKAAALLASAASCLSVACVLLDCNVGNDKTPANFDQEFLVGNDETPEDLQNPCCARFGSVGPASLSFQNGKGMRLTRGSPSRGTLCLGPHGTRGRGPRGTLCLGALPGSHSVWQRLALPMPLAVPCRLQNVPSPFGRPLVSLPKCPAPWSRRAPLNLGGLKCRLVGFLDLKMSLSDF